MDFLKRTRRRLSKLFPILAQSNLNHTDDRPKDYAWLGPPNLQLGLSSNQYDDRLLGKRDEVLIAAVAAVVLQVGLLAIATVTVYHPRTRRAIATEPKDYGYPCYMLGSVLLSIGIGLCSLAVERNTTEHDWRVLKPDRKDADLEQESDVVTSYKPLVDDCLRLLWLQRTQEVNEQAFDGYTILAGPKNHIVTSSRIEDTKKSSMGLAKVEVSKASGRTKGSSSTSSEDPYSSSNDVRSFRLRQTV